MHLMPFFTPTPRQVLPRPTAIETGRVSLQNDAHSLRDPPGTPGFGNVQSSVAFSGLDVLSDPSLSSLPKLLEAHFEAEPYSMHLMPFFTPTPKQALPRPTATEIERVSLQNDAHSPSDSNRTSGKKSWF